MPDSTEAENARILSAAESILPDLPELLPEECDAVAAELAPMLEEAKAASGEEQADAVDGIVALLARFSATRLLLAAVLRAADTTRGVAPDLAAGDSVLAGRLGDVGDGVEVKCRTCGFVNKLSYRPPDDDLPQCQNSEPEPHELAPA
jgi:hypothetical protein